MAVKQKGHFVTALVVFITAAFISFGFLSHPVAADSYPINPDGTCNDSDKKSADGKTCDTGAATTAGTVTGDNAVTNTTTCAVEKIGWIVCPVLEQAAKLSDKTFGVLADNFLTTDPQLVSNNSGTKVAWDIARNIANIMFIIAFLIIIVSQVTSMGINNYGIKKMLPRLVIAAIAVNVSYYICQLVVDVTNILGYEIQNMLTDVSNSIGPSVFGNASQYGVTQAQNGWGNFLSVITVGSLALAGVVWLVMGPMVAVIVMVVITALTILVILLLRKALIVLLIVISPIAIVLYLLPNTERLFSKWMKMFTQILMVFPVIGLLFGAGQLASTIVLVAGSQNDDQVVAARDCNPDDKDAKDKFKVDHPSSYVECGVPAVSIQGQKDGQETPCTGGDGAKAGSGCKRTVGVLTGLIAMGIAVAPLIAVWSVLKGAIGAAGAIGGKVTSGISKGAGGFTKRAEQKDSDRQTRMSNRALNDRGVPVVRGMYQRRAEKQHKRDTMSAIQKQNASTYTSRLAADENTGYAEQLAGKSLFGKATDKDAERARGSAAAAVARAAEEEIRNEESAFETASLSSDQIRQIGKGLTITSGDGRSFGGANAQKAAMARMAREADVDGLEGAAKASSGATAQYLAQAINSNYSGIKSKGAHLTDGALLDSLRNGTGQSDATLNTSMNNAMGSMGAELMATQKSTSLRRIGANIAAGSSNATSATSARSALQGNAILHDKMSQSDKAIISTW